MARLDRWRQARREREMEARLWRLLENLRDEGKLEGDFYLHGDMVPVLGRRKVDAILSEFGLPVAVEERWRDAA